MRLTLPNSRFLAALQAVSSAVPRRTTLPVLNNLLLRAEGDSLSLSATDLDLSITRSIDADVTSPGALTVPAQKLLALVKELPGNEDVDLEVKGDQFTLRCGATKVKLSGLPVEEYPTFPEVDFASSWSVDGATLKAMIEKVAFAASTEENRPILNGVLWQLLDSEMRMVATDGYKLARFISKIDNTADVSAQLIVPPKALQQINRLVEDGDTVEVSQSENHLGFRKTGILVLTRLIEGPYPNYENIIPKNNDKTLIVDRPAFEQAVKRMAVISNDQTHRIKLSMGGSALRFSVETPDLGEASDEMPADYSGEPLDIAFNASYLMEVLKNFDTPKLKLEMKAPEKAALLYPAADDGGDAEEDYTALLMPLRIT